MKSRATKSRATKSRLAKSKVSKLRVSRLRATKSKSRKTKVATPYRGDSVGAFVLGSPPDLLRMDLVKSPRHHELLAEVWLGPKTAGPPGHVHGGCLAAILDEMMGSTAWHFSLRVVAAKIEVEFLKMAPVKQNYQIRGRIIKIEGRKVFVQAELFGRKTLYAKSTGLFVQLSPEQIKSLAIKT